MRPHGYRINGSRIGRSRRTVIPNTVRNCRRLAMLDVAFVAILVGLAALVVGFATACDRLLGPDEAVLSEEGREGARTELESA